jgi:phosphonoacetate hydrolase
MNEQRRLPREVTVNGRAYAMPAQPTVAICVDGSEPGYIEAAVEAGLAPNFERILASGANLLADAVVPTFTNPNNLSIVTGTPPEVHGIAGNFFYDITSGTEVMMNEARFLRVDTLFKALHDAGGRVAVITAKDKLRLLLGKGLDFASGRAIAFSSEKADKATLADNGIEDLLALVGMPVPSVYSAELSEFVFAAGVKLVTRFRPDVMYLSTTDYIQHKATPGSAVANAFYAMIDRYVGELDRLGCVVALTADHGMNDKHGADGKPDVLYLQDWFDARVGPGKARVILPITDPYVVHHGALGSFATVYLPEGTDIAGTVAAVASVEGVEAALTRDQACARFELPPDRVGDIVVVSTRHKVLGTAAVRHDLSGLDAPLRSHGGISEQRVPLIVNRPVSVPEGHRLRNFDIFDLALNRVQ